MQMPEINPFSISDFRITLKNNFCSLLKTVVGTKSKLLIEEVEKFFYPKENDEIPLILLESLYIQVSKIVPHNKVNKAKLNSINQILLLIKKNNLQKQDTQNYALFNFIKQTQIAQITELGTKIQSLNSQKNELNMEKHFITSQIEEILDKLSKDIDDYIELSLLLNDPSKLDKNDKRMMRIVIDVTHITNGLNVDIAAKSMSYYIQHNH